MLYEPELPQDNPTQVYRLHLRIHKEHYFRATSKSEIDIEFSNESTLINELAYLQQAKGNRLKVKISLPEGMKIEDLPSYVSSQFFSYAYCPYFTESDRIDLSSKTNRDRLAGNLNRSCFIAMKAPEGFFTSEQQTLLKDIFKNRRKETFNNARLTSWFSIISLVMMASAFYFAPFVYSELASVALVFLATGLMGSIFSVLRESTLNLLARKYDSVEKIAEVTTPDEINALKDGLEAKTWTGYFSSWTKQNNYQHLRAFCAGEKYACEGNKEMVEQIKRLSL